MKKLAIYIKEINSLNARWDTRSIWGDNTHWWKSFVRLGELPGAISDPPITTAEAKQLNAIRDKHIANNFHEEKYEGVDDILDMGEKGISDKHNREIINKLTSKRRKSTIYCFLIKHKW